MNSVADSLKYHEIPALKQIYLECAHMQEVK